MTRVGHALLTLVGGACLALGCSGATPRDINFNTDAGSGFEPPPVSFDTGAAGRATTAGATAGAGGAAGDIGAAGAGGSGGAAGTGTASSDADTDAASDVGAP